MSSSNRYATFVVAFAITTDSMIYTLVLPFLPELFAGRLHVPEDEVSQWTSFSFEAFAVAALVSNAVVGIFTDASVSKSKPFMLSIVIMLASTLVFFLGTTPAMIVISRGIQGASTTFVWVSGLAFLVSQVGESDLGEYVGWTTVGVAVGEIIGPLLGGPVYDHLGHWATFGFVEALLVIDILLRLFVKEKRKESDTEERGQQSSEADHLIRNGEQNTSDYESTPAILRTADQLNTIARSLALNWFGTVLTLIVIFMVRGALEVALPLYLERQYSWTPTNIGLTLLTLLFPAAINPVIGRFTSRYGPRWWSVGAFTVCGAAMISFGNVSGDSHRSKVFFVIHAAVVGVALAVLVNSNQVAVSVASQRYVMVVNRSKNNGESLGGVLSWLSPGKMLSGVTTSWSAGILLGPGYSSLINYTKDEGWAIFCRGLGGACLVAALASLFLWRKW